MAIPRRSSWRPWLAWAHAWLGTALALWLLVVAVTGTILGFRTTIERGGNAQAQAAWVARDPDVLAQQMARIDQRFGNEVALVFLATPDMMVDRLWLTDGRSAMLHPMTGQTVRQWGPRGSTVDVILAIHTLAVFGAPGTALAGSFALLLALLCLAGLVLWWPWRERLRLELPWFTASRPDLLAGHRDWGLIVALPLGFMALTGMALSWPQASAALLTTQQTEPPARTGGPIAWPAVLATAARAFPDARIQRVVWPGAQDRAVTVHLRARGDWAPEGHSRVRLEPATGAMLSRVDGATLSGGAFLHQALFALHSGSALGPWHVGLVRILGIGVLCVALYGVIAFTRPMVRRRRERRARLSANRP